MARSDGCKRIQKAVMFEQLYELKTTGGLLSEKFVTLQFEEKNHFIFEAIVDTSKKLENNIFTL